MKVSATKGDKLFYHCQYLTGQSDCPDYLISAYLLWSMLPSVIPLGSIEVPLLLYPRGLNVEGYREVLKEQ